MRFLRAKRPIRIEQVVTDRGWNDPAALEHYRRLIGLVGALPALDGWQHATLVSPVFVWLLLTRISGVRMLDATARRRWGDDPDYLEYTARTPRLIPVPPRMQSRGAAAR